MVLGTGGHFTFHVINALIKQGIVPISYVQSGQSKLQSNGYFHKVLLEINIKTSPLVKLLSNQSVPFKYDAEINLIDYVSSQAPDFILVACWPKYLTENVLLLAKKAAVNLHPSLLPKFRGVDPIRTQLKTTDRKFGVSLHLMNEQFDQGDVVLQKSLDLEVNVDYKQIETKAAEAGAGLFIHAMQTFDTPGWNLIKQVD